MENEDVATDAEVMDILKNGKNARKNTMLCKQNLHQQKRIDTFISSLPEVQKISISQNLLYANIEFVHALAAGDQGYKCPEVDIALHVLGREGHFAASKRYALDAKFTYLEQCKTFSRISELNAAYMCPVAAAHLYFADCINKENKHNLLANPGNLHILALLVYNRPAAILDYNAKAIEGAKNGIGGCIWVCDGGGTYGAKVDGKHKVHVEKSNGVGADWIYNKYKQLVDAGKYAADTQKRATINTLSSISVMGLMLQCSDTYKADKLQSKCTGEIASRLAMTELAIGAKNDTSHQTAAALVHVIPRQTDDNAVKKYVTSAKGDADTRVNVTYDMLLYPALEICSSNNVNLLHAYERIYTVTRVMRMTASSSQIVEHSTNSRVPVIRGTTRSNSVHTMKNGVLASTRLCFVDIPSIASAIALTQREGFLGEQIRNSPISSTIWETFTSHMECNEGYLSEVSIDKETIPRHKDQAQTRAVSKSLMVIAATQMFRVAWPNALHGEGENPSLDELCGDEEMGVDEHPTERANSELRDVTHLAAITDAANHFASTGIHPAVVPSMICDYLDQNLSLPVVILLSLFCYDLRVPIIETDVILSWFATGTMENLDAQHKLGSWWSQIDPDHIFLDTTTNNPTDIFLSTAGHPDWNAPPSRQNPDDNNQQQAVAAYVCSHFQTRKQATSLSKEQLASEFAQSIESHFYDILQGPKLKAKHMEIELQRFLGKSFPFLSFYGNLRNHTSRDGLGAGLQGPTVPSISDNMNHTPFKTINPTLELSAYTLAVDFRALLWFASISGSVGRTFQRHDISQDTKYA
eukprot:592776-Rhodomonas_salina.1